MKIVRRKRRSLDQLICNIICIIIVTVELKWITSTDGFVIIERQNSIPRGLFSSNNINDYHVDKALLMMKKSDKNADIDVEARHVLHSRNDNYQTIDFMSWSKTTVIALIVFIAPFVGNLGTTLAAEETILATQRSVEINTKKRETALEEIWQLADKYYLDRNFNNQNWKNVREKYVAQLGTSQDEGLEMKLASEMVSTLGDKYSRVLDKKAYSDIQKYDLIGVGATLMPDENKNIKVGAPPVQGSAAYKAGIQYGDIITAVDGHKTAGRSSFDIIDQINDEPNKKELTFSVYRPEAELSFDVTLPRVFQQVRNPISYSVSEKRDDGTIVGYIRIAEFNSLVNKKLKDALLDLENNMHANAYVIDIRSNPGGAFQSAVEISSFFLNEKIATSVVDNNKQNIPFKTSMGNTIVDDNHPVVLWIDGNSASAAEVFASALHDNCRALIMGKQKSFGKGLIQAVYGLKNGSGLVLSVAKYITPSGNDIQGNGISPDIASNNLPNFLVVAFFNPDTSNVNFHDYDTWHNTCLDR